MANIADILRTKTTYSYEFFPPQTDEGVQRLETTIDRLAVTQPDFISVTYGAGGQGQRTRTQELVSAHGARLDFPVMPHLTCVSHARPEIDALVDAYAATGVDNILALRGDGVPSGDYRHAIDLVSQIKQRQPHMAVGTAAHPEVHPMSASRESDRQHLAAKLQVADFAITQFFFDADDYSRMRDELHDLGCDQPIIPGIMLFRSMAGLQKMADMNNTALPPSLMEQLDAATRDVEPAVATQRVGHIAVDTAVDLIGHLQDEAVPGFHIYTLNQSDTALALYDQLPDSL